jgi:hypothetical protein
MLSWLADLLLNAGADFAGLFDSKDAASFVVVQMAMALLVLAAVVSVIVYWESLVEYWRSLWRPRT